MRPKYNLRLPSGNIGARFHIFFTSKLRSELPSPSLSRIHTPRKAPDLTSQEAVWTPGHVWTWSEENLHSLCRASGMREIVDYFKKLPTLHLYFWSENFLKYTVHTFFWAVNIWSVRLQNEKGGGRWSARGRSSNLFKLLIFVEFYAYLFVNYSLFYFTTNLRKI